MTTSHHHISSKDFSKVTLRKLAKLNIYVIGSTWLPGNDGSYANGMTGYELDDNGCGKVRTFMGVLAMSGAK